MSTMLEEVEIHSKKDRNTGVHLSIRMPTVCKAKPMSLVPMPMNSAVKSNEDTDANKWVLMNASNNGEDAKVNVDVRSCANMHSGSVMRDRAVITSADAHTDVNIGIK